MNERYIVTSRLGERVIRTNNITEAQAWANRMGGRVIDRKDKADGVRVLAAAR